MKTKLMLIALLISAYSNATVRTLNNNNPSPGQFSTIAAAHNASVNGDTIYVSGSPTSYGAFSVTKLLTIIGTGHNPDKQNPLVSSFGNLTLSSGSSGSKIIGINFLTPITVTTSNVTYEHCKFSGVVQATVNSLSFNFNKCIFLGTALSATIANSPETANYNNCIFNSSITTSIGNISGLAGSAVNCLFLGNAVNSFAFTLNNFVVTNCIFYGTSPQASGSSIVTNNLSFACPNNSFNGTTQSGNIVNQDPLFVNYPSATGFHITDDYHLLSNSPGANYGTDGKDIGLYGGSTGIFFHMGGEPSIPQIRQVNAVPTTVPIGQTINVNVISTVKL